MGDISEVFLDSPSLQQLSLSSVNEASHDPLFALHHYDRNAIIAVSQSGLIVSRDMRTSVSSNVGHVKDALLGVASNGSFVWTLGATGVLTGWDVRQPCSQFTQLSLCNVGSAAVISCSSDGALVSLTSPKADIHVYDSRAAVNAEKPMFTHKGHSFEGEQVSAMGWHPSLPCVISADVLGNMHAWMWDSTRITL